MKKLMLVILSAALLSGCAGLDILSKNLKGHIDLQYQDQTSDVKLDMTKDRLYGSMSISDPNKLKGK
jgi:hypothetical protein